MSQRTTATIRPGLRRGWDVFLAGVYWASFPEYSEAVDACRLKGYAVQ
jgi:hypothetical protein